MKLRYFFYTLLTLLLSCLCLSSIAGDESGDGQRATPKSIEVAAPQPQPDSYLTASDSTRKVGFGLKVGVGLSNTNFNKGYPKPAVPLETVWRTGFMGGLVLEIPLYKQLYLQQEYAYTLLQGEAKEVGAAYRLSYLSLPVLLKYKAFPRLSLLAGPHFDLLVQAKERMDANYNDITHHIEERSIGAIAGVQYHFSHKVAMDARLVHGINHIGVRRNGTTKEFKLELIQLAVILMPFR